MKYPIKTDDFREKVVVVAQVIALIVSNFTTFTLADCNTEACKECVLDCLRKQPEQVVEACVVKCFEKATIHDQILHSIN